MIICYSQSLQVCSLQLHQLSGIKHLSYACIHTGPDYFCLKHIRDASERMLTRFFLLQHFTIWVVKCIILPQCALHFPLINQMSTGS